MRISKVDPDLAKAQGEKALNPANGGVITNNADNFNISLYGGIFKPARICFNWGDTRMAATMESVLAGYEDDRITKLFEPVTADGLVNDHPNWPYKGIRNGAYLVAKDDRLPFSTISNTFKSVTSRRFLTASDVLFTMAEASLRGWNGAGAAKDNYEAGVRASFAEWSAGGVDAYLEDDTKLPLIM